MPSFKLRKKMIGASTDGELRKLEADRTTEDTWYSDLASRVGYFYDYYHDDFKTQLNNLEPSEDNNKIPIEVKYIVYSSQTFSKDAITYHIQFKPSFDYHDTVEYYDEFFGNRYNATFPIGLYVDLPDEKGRYNRWLCVGLANNNDPQFPTYEILRCDYILQWIFDDKKYQMPCVLRSQNSYNSGVWHDYRIESIEDQQQFLLPLSRITENIYYNMRMIIDNKVLSEPRAWRMTKINRIAHNGCLLGTLAQDRYDQHKDYIELDANDEVIGMWADYWNDSVEPTDPVQDEPKTVYSIINYSGITPEIKIGGGYKKYTVVFFDGEEQIDPIDGIWEFSYRHSEKDIPIDASELVTTIINDNVIKVKFLGDAEYYDGILTLTHTTEDEIISSLDVYINTL